ncbi:MAG: fibronectin type III domain-containing protein, partial [ANME-2 cluster archaeon]|nr:fibronectin type III domain-containing protein [ANME-2 cluster archaeon]
SGTKYLNASMNNTNGTSSITQWSIIVQSIPDAPNITNVASSGVTRSQAHITWDTNQSDSDNRVKYSIYPDLSTHNWSSWDNNTDSVHILLTDLSPLTKYYYSAYSYNEINNSLNSNSSIFNFTTAGNAAAHGNVKDKSGGQLICNITVYDEDGTTVLYSITGHSFDWDDVPIGGYILFDALSSKNVSAKFKINGSSNDSTIILDDYGLNNPESTMSSGNPVKYVNVSAVNVSYEYVEVKILCNDAELGNRNENGLTMYHHKNGAWNNLPTTVDAANNTFTAQTSSLSTLSVGDAAKLLVFTDKQVYADDPFNADTLNNWGTNTIDLKINVYVIVLDDEGYVLRNISGSNITGTLKDTQLLDHWDGTADTAAVHHVINPGSYSEGSFYDLTIGGETSYPFNDEGNSPDLVAGDGIFSA